LIVAQLRRTRKVRDTHERAWSRHCVNNALRRNDKDVFHNTHATYRESRQIDKLAKLSWNRCELITAQLRRTSNVRDAHERAWSRHHHSDVHLRGDMTIIDVAHATYIEFRQIDELAELSWKRCKSIVVQLRRTRNVRDTPSSQYCTPSSRQVQGSHHSRDVRRVPSN